MAENKLDIIPPYKLSENGIRSLSDRPNAGKRYGDPGMSAADLKERFDKNSLILLEAVNKIIRYINGEGSGGISSLIKTEIEEYATLYLIIAAFSNGEFAENILKLFPNIAAQNEEDPTERANGLMSLQSIINEISKELSFLNERIGDIGSDDGTNITNDTNISYMRILGTNNTAIVRGIEVISFDKAAQTLTLTTVEGLAAGQLLGAWYYDEDENVYDSAKETILSVNAETNTVTVTNDEEVLSWLIPRGEAERSSEISMGYWVTPFNDSEAGEIMEFGRENQGIRLGGLMSGAGNKGYTGTVVGGDRNKALAPNAVTFGSRTEVHSDNGMAINYKTKVTAPAGFAQGVFSESNGFAGAAFNRSKANGVRSFSKGNYTEANGMASSSEGSGTIADGDNQHVQGIFNIKDKNGNFADIIGNGRGVDADKRDNAQATDWSGNEYNAGNVYVGVTFPKDGSKPTVTDQNRLITAAEVNAKSSNLMSLTEKLISVSTDDKYVLYEDTSENIGFDKTTETCKNYYANNEIVTAKIGDKVETLGVNNFRTCQRLTTVTFGENSALTTIGNFAFYKSYKFSAITIPAGVASIGKQVFYDCTALESVTFLGTPTTVSADIFSGCTKLTDIYVPWAEGAVTGAPWGAPSTTVVHYAGGEDTEFSHILGVTKLGEIILGG